ncbi:MAG TPA: vitamin K epoxide reductase family protein, partial [Anaerolineales bacterium]|nr:vitamin K epoxide reductase family protein [Anaerolineales bacterium]
MSQDRQAQRPARARLMLALVALLASAAFAGPTPTYKACHICDLEPSAALPEPATAPAVVHAVMFWMEACGHCEEVLNNVLPPLQSSYGEHLQVLLIQLVDQASVDRLFQAADELGVAKENVGVPFLIVGRSVLIGSGEIPDQFPGIIDAGLASGGIAFPELTSLADLAPERAGAEVAQPTARASAAPSPTPLPAGTPTPTANSFGFAVAWGVMALLGLSVLFTLYAFLGGPLPRFAALTSGRSWLVPLLIGIGLIIAGYLSYVEFARVEAFCGPIGDCNAVQSSRYAKLFGIIPMGLFGLAGYVAMLAAWTWPH